MTSNHVMLESFYALEVVVLATDFVCIAMRTTQVNPFQVVSKKDKEKMLETQCWELGVVVIKNRYDHFLFDEAVVEGLAFMIFLYSWAVSHRPTQFVTMKSCWNLMKCISSPRPLT